MIRCSRLILTALALLQGSLALATPTVIAEKNCVSASIARAHSTITDYDNYSKIPGATYEMKFPGFKPITMLRMDKSQGKFFTITASETNAYVWVVMQPTNLSDSRYYPQFLLHCTSSFVTETKMVHRCNMVKTAKHYGLQDFRSVLTVTTGSNHCAPDQTFLDYELVLDSNPAEVNEIKREVIRPMGMIVGGLVDAIFQEEAFFKGYYKNFYESWVKSL